mgnify:FL=1
MKALETIQTLEDTIISADAAIQKLQVVAKVNKKKAIKNAIDALSSAISSLGTSKNSAQKKLKWGGKANKYNPEKPIRKILFSFKKENMEQEVGKVASEISAIAGNLESIGPEGELMINNSTNERVKMTKAFFSNIESAKKDIQKASEQTAKAV